MANASCLYPGVRRADDELPGIAALRRRARHDLPRVETVVGSDQQLSGCFASRCRGKVGCLVLHRFGSRRATGIRYPAPASERCGNAVDTGERREYISHGGCAADWRCDPEPGEQCDQVWETPERYPGALFQGE